MESHMQLVLKRKFPVVASQTLILLIGTVASLCIHNMNTIPRILAIRSSMEFAQAPQPTTHSNMSRALKLNDLQDLSKMYEAEFNNPDLHDRILIFDVVASENASNGNDSTDESDGETSETEKNEVLNDQKKTGIEDCENALKYENGKLYLITDVHPYQSNVSFCFNHGLT